MREAISLTQIKVDCFLIVEKVWMGGQVQQVVTGQGGRMCTFCTDLTKRDTDTRLEHQERHRHTAPTQRGTETHDSNTKRDTDTHLKHKRDTDTRLEHKERQHRHRRRTQSQADTGAHCKGDLRPIYAFDTLLNIPRRNSCPK